MKLKLHLVFLISKSRTDLLDCHPLIREYFGTKMKTEQPNIWLQAHERLYSYYLLTKRAEEQGATHINSRQLAENLLIGSKK